MRLARLLAAAVLAAARLGVTLMTLGLLFAILTGLSWVVVGAVVGLAEKHGCGTARQQIVSQALTGAIAVAVLAAGVSLQPGNPTFSLRSDIPSALWTILWGFLNYWMTVCMGRAMLLGPNGTVWTIVQCGFIFPFTMGVAIGNTALTAPRALGALCVLAGVVFCGMARTTGGSAPRTPADSHSSLVTRHSSLPTPVTASASWLPPALAGFVLCGVNQCAQCMASLGPPETRPTALVRTVCGVAGAGLAIIMDFGGRRLLRRGPAAPDPGLRAKYLYLLKICGIGSAIVFLSRFLFLYNALDRLEAAGRIAVANPVMLSACLVGFTLYGTFALHERPSRPQLLGTAFALAGIALIAA